MLAGGDWRGERDVSGDKFRQVATDFFVAPQLTEAGTSPAARAAGIRTVINNRPDGEAADQLTDAEARALAQANGLAYVFVPVVSGGIGPATIASFAAAVADHPGPHLAYCRSGTRSCHMWAFATAGERPVEATLAGRGRCRLRPDTGPPLLERLAGRLSLAAQRIASSMNIPQKASASGGPNGTAVSARSGRLCASASSRPSRAAASTTQGRLARPSQAPAAASSFASPSPGRPAPQPAIDLADARPSDQ